jgi:hypothetical protein
MNPNFIIFLKTSAKVIAAGFFVFLIIYVITTYTAIDLEKIGAYAMYGFFGFVMVFMMALIIGVTLKSIWVNVMRRTGNITLCCLDANNEGVHIVGSHYFSGGESTDGYYSYHHYFIRLSDGKMFMSKKIKDEKHLSASVEELMRQTKLQLKPNLAATISVGGNTDDDVPTHRILSVPNGELHIHGFENWLDEGFKVSLRKDSIVKWQRRI